MQISDTLTDRSFPIVHKLSSFVFLICLEASWIQFYQTFNPSRHLFKVINYHLGSEIFVLEDTCGVIVTEKDNWYVVNDGDVGLVDNHVVNCRAVNFFSYNNI
jgi:hypothetical protein